MLINVNMNRKSLFISTAVAFFLSSGVSAQKKSDTIATKNIEEVVVVAFGKQKKETVVGSNAQITAKQIEGRALTNVAQALEGAAPGIQIASGSGQPGSSPTVRIRGIGSVNAASGPLYVVDGVIFNNGLASLNPDDIETFNILKDAAATSLYGSSAANGVILITTKKGRKGRDVVRLSAVTGMSERSVSQYDRVGPADYYRLAWTAIRNGRLTSGANTTVADANNYATLNLINVLKQNVYDVPDAMLVTNGVFNPNAKLKYTDLDWDREVAKRGFRQSYDLSYSGGTERTTYFASLGYLNETGYIIKSDLERFTGRINVESKVRNWLKVGLNVSGSNSYGNNAVDGADNANAIINPYYFARRMGPIYSPFLHDAQGNNIYDADGNKVYDLAQVRGGDAYSGRHTIAENLYNKDYNRIFNLSSRFNVEMTLLKGLTLSSIVGYDTRNFRNAQYQNKIIGDGAPGGTATRSSSLTQTVNWIQLLNYKKSFQGHNFEGLLGHESYKFYYENLYGYKQGQVGADNDELINFITPTTLYSYADNYRKEGAFARLNYDYNEKYLLSASYRRDGSSRFNKDTRWNGYWSLGLGWRIDRENFMKDVNFINTLKLRGSYGEVGNDQILTTSGTPSYYAYQDLFNLGYNNGQEAGFLLGVVADPNITWEKNKQMDVGVDFGFLHNRITGSVEWYNRETSDLLFGVPMPVSAGVPGGKINRNTATMYNRGLELGLNIKALKKQNFGVDLFVNLGTYKNQITKLPDGQSEILNGTKKLMVGHSIYDFWLRQWYGVDPTDGAGLFLLDDAFVGTTAADIRQINGVNVTTNFNKAKYDYSGTAIPDWYGSFGTNIKISNFYLNTLFTFQLGGKVYDSNYAQLMSGYPQGIALHSDMLNAWQNPGDITDVPKMDSQWASLYSAGSTRWLVKSDYIVLKSLVVGYDFKKETIEEFGISGLKLFLNGENLWTKTARKGMEPQENLNGTTVNRYSPSRIVSLGLNVTF